MKFGDVNWFFMSLQNFSRLVYFCLENKAIIRISFIDSRLHNFQSLYWRLLTTDYIVFHPKIPWLVLPVRGFLSLFWRETHTRFPPRPEEDEEKQGPRAVNREELATVRERRRLERGSCWSELLGLVDPEARSDSSRGFVSILDSCVRISFGYTLATATECQKSTKTSPFLRLELTQVRACLFFFLPLSAIYVISVVYL